MPLFSYTARDQFNRPQTGVREAASVMSLAGSLRAQGWLVLTIEAAGPDGAGLAAALDPRLLLPVRSVDVELALQQVAVMLRSGLTLLHALRTAAENSDRRRLRRILRRVAERIEEGSAFADALAEHAVFSRFVVQLARVGEATGHLDSVLSRAAEMLERRRLLRTQVLTALGYPAVTLLGAIGVAVFMVLGVIPRLAEFLKGMGRRLPPSTQSLVDLSHWMQIHGLAVGALTLTAAVGVALAYLTPAGRRAADAFLLRLPVAGKVLRVAGTALFARAFGTLIGSGVTVLEALRTAEDLGHNHHLGRIVAAARERVFNGEGLAGTLAQRHGFMPMLSHMVAVGEASGTLDTVLDEVARFHETQLASIIKQLTALIEPLIIVVVGVVVGYVYISFFLAMYSVVGSR